MEPSGVDLPSFPAPRTDPLGVADELLRLREREPVARVRLPDGSEAWLVTSPGVGRQVLGNRRFSSDATRPGFPQTSTLRRDAPLGRTLIRIDPPEHTRLRRLLNPDFVVSRVEALRPGVARIAGALLDEVVSEGPPADLVEAFARPLPALVIAEVLGVPDAERRHFEDLSRRLVTSADGPDRAIQAMEGLRDYMERLVMARRATPGEDVLSRLVELEEAGELDHDQAVDTGRLLLLAGHVTTANMIALGVLMLLRHPAQLAAVRGDPTLMRAGVEELLRHQTLIQGGLRRGQPRPGPGRRLLRRAPGHAEPPGLRLRLPPVPGPAPGQGRAGRGPDGSLHASPDPRRRGPRGGHLVPRGRVPARAPSAAGHLVTRLRPPTGATGGRPSQRRTFPVPAAPGWTSDPGRWKVIEFVNTPIERSYSARTL